MPEVIDKMQVEVSPELSNIEKYRLGLLPLTISAEIASEVSGIGEARIRSYILDEANKLPGFWAGKRNYRIITSQLEEYLKGKFNAE